MEEISTNPESSGRDAKGRFIAGNPDASNKRGHRNKLSNAFFKDLAAEWQKSGRKVLAFVAKNDPTTFLRVIGALQTKEQLKEGEQLRTLIVSLIGPPDGDPSIDVDGRQFNGHSIEGQYLNVDEDNTDEDEEGQVGSANGNSPAYQPHEIRMTPVKTDIALAAPENDTTGKPVKTNGDTLPSGAFGTHDQPKHLSRKESAEAAVKSPKARRRS